MLIYLFTHVCARVNVNEVIKPPERCLHVVSVVASQKTRDSTR